MNLRKRNRLMLMVIVGVVWALAAGLFFVGFRQKVVYFYDPTEIIAQSPAIGTRLRVGGIVEEGSFEKQDGLSVVFQISDGANKLAVKFEGQLPDLFREGQGVIAEGALDADGYFVADTVLAKHDETYMPKEVADSLKKRGMWKGEEAN